MLTSLKAVAYRVSDLKKAKEWYQHVLGKEPTFDSPLVVSFTVGDSVLSLVPAADGAAGQASLTTPYWGVEDVESVQRRLLEAGATARGEIITTALKSRAATVVDPFGNVLGILSAPPVPGKKSLADQASDSALGVTLFRAFAASEERAEIRGPDYLAEIFLPGEFKAVLKNPAAREWIKGKAPGSYEYFFARTAWFDCAVREALRANLPQVVFLGAGYDTRPYRFESLIQGTHLFELDVESTQRRKRDLLATAKVQVPAKLTHVPVDFARDNLAELLSRAGFDKTAKTLFVWEGVTYYLPAAAVDQVLAFIRANSSPGSIVCFDYLADAPDMSARYGVAESLELMRTTYHAEPVQFRIPEGSIEPFLSERGFSVLAHLSTKDMERRYLTLPGGVAAGKVLACFRLVEAKTRV